MPPATPYLIQLDVTAKSLADETALIKGLKKLAADEPSFGVVIEPGTRRCTLTGMSETQLDAKLDMLKRDFGVEMDIGAPQVAYREKLIRRCDIDYTHKKLVGGVRQYARVRIVFEPNIEGAGNILDFALGGGELPDNYLAGVRSGFESALQQGVAHECPVFDLKATLVDSAWHETESSALAFEIAARAATREALAKGGCVLLEPIMRVEVSAPREYEGSLIGDMHSRRGEIVERAENEGRVALIALAPLANLFGYPQQLRSFTQGRGGHVMRFSHYAEVPTPRTPGPDGRFPPAIGMRQTA